MDSVTEILRKRLPLGDPFWLKPKYLRRGRLVDSALTLLAQGKQIEAQWWEQASGELRCKACQHKWQAGYAVAAAVVRCPSCGSLNADDSDFVAHAECRPFIKGGQRFLQEYDCRLLKHHFEVTGPGYVGHPDWLMSIEITVADVTLIRGEYLIDVKCGEPPPPKIRREDCDSQGHVFSYEVANPMDYYERYQLALYSYAHPTPGVKRANLHVFNGTYKLLERTERSDLHEALVIVQNHNIMRRFE